MKSQLKVRVICLSFILIILSTVSSSSGASETNSTLPENAWHIMCEMLHPSKFIYSASVTDPPCGLQCVYLESSQSGSSYYDISRSIDHNLNDGVYCDRDHVCKSGKCILDFHENGVGGGGGGGDSSSRADKQGIVVVEVLNGKVPQRDSFSASDTYIKLFIKSPSSNSINDSDAKATDNKFGTTKVAWDTNEPSFEGQIFKIEKVAISSTVMLVLYDKDRMNQDDYIATVYVPIKNVLSSGKNHRPQMLFFPPDGDYFINCTISWIGM